MCQGRMGYFITYVSRQVGCLCVKGDWVVVLLMGHSRMGCYLTYVSRQIDIFITYVSRQDGCFAGYIIYLS